MLHCHHRGIHQQVTAGDAASHRARTHVNGDIARTQKEELDIVEAVQEAQLPPGAIHAVAAFTQHGDGRFGQRTLVRDGDSKHEILS